jgi:hypothetical protein
MIKFIILVIIMNAVLVVGNLTTHDVFMKINAPDQVEAGSEVEVEIELHKAGLSGFARFQQQLPHGVTAIPVYPADMDFSFEDNTVKMIWLSLPQDNIITLRYRIRLNERLKGNLQLDGTFSYIENNQRRVTSVSGPLLAVNPSPAIETKYLVEIGEADRKLLSPSPVNELSGKIAAIRQYPMPVDDLGYIVNILVSKEGNNHIAKIEETIPEGYTAVELESKGGIFSFSDQRVRIIWNNLPTGNHFIVSYRLIPGNGSTGEPRPDGEFSIMSRGITASRQIIHKNEDIKGLTVSQTTELIASVQGENTGPLQSPASRPAQGQLLASISSGIELKNPLQTEPGVYYRVQIAAGQRPVDIDRYFSRMNITGEVQTEIHDGWIKYSIGSYYNYRTARDQRVLIRNTTSIGGAFVAAYNEGTRITVQEALMISKHKWYQ